MGRDDTGLATQLVNFSVLAACTNLRQGRTDYRLLLLSNLKISPSLQKSHLC